MKVWFPVIQANSGSDIFTERLAAALKKSGIETIVTCYPGYFEFFPFLLSFISPPEGTDIIHTNSWNGFAFSGNHLPCIVTEHLTVLDPLFRQHKSLWQNLYHRTAIHWFERLSLSNAAAITAVSNFAAAGLQRAYNLSDVSVIHNWVDTELFKPAKESAYADNDPLRLLFVGNLSKRKGADLLAPIMCHLENGFELQIVGSNCSRLPGKLPSNIHYAGYKTGQNLVDAYRRCDALLFPSRHEGFGLVALEAMSCGKPVIAADSASLPEIVEHEVTGLLCPVDDVNCFVQACRRIKENIELSHQYGDAARQRAVDFFSEDAAISKYTKLYKAVLRRNTRHQSDVDSG